MNILKQLGISALAAIVVVWIGFSIVPRVQTTVVNNPSNPSQNLGSSNRIPFNDLTVGDLTWKYAKVPLTTATTTVCQIVGPAATSTLISAGISFTTSSTSASTVTLAKAAKNTNATTTLIGNRIAIAANAQDTIVASTTAAQLAAEATIFGPNELFVVSMEGNGGTWSPVGSCAAVFQSFSTF